MIKPILPMLATSGQPFDSDEYSYEVKWDGVRALAAIEGDHWQLWGRDLADYAGRYPELDVLRRLPSGTVVDGELVVFKDGRPDLGAVLGRHQLLNPDRIRFAHRQTPVRFVLFDVLYHQGKSLMREPFHRRRSVLVDLLTAMGEVPELAFSEGIAGHGQAFFERVAAQGLEGVMAKRADSRYLPGKRSPAWMKIKPTGVVVCVVIGYVPSRMGVHSLLVATADQGRLRYVGEVGSGFTDQMKAELGRRLGRVSAATVGSALLPKGGVGGAGRLLPRAVLAVDAQRLSPWCLFQRIDRKPGVTDIPPRAEQDQPFPKFSFLLTANLRLAGVRDSAVPLEHCRRDART